jgi:glycosyltransferase involved in cell wall biosynthesis
MTRAVVVLAVLPEYRGNFLSELKTLAENSSTDLVIVAGDTQLDRTVKSAEFPGVIRVANRGLFGRRLLWQKGALRHIRLRDDVAVVDLNPRSLTAWVILIMRKLRGRRTLVWGHINPRRGAHAPTAGLRRRMRRLADGVISYTWTDARQVMSSDENEPVWVAANGLYPQNFLAFDTSEVRNRFLYVGRVEPSKKPLLALEAFARARRSGRLPSTSRLTFVGTGSQLPLLRSRVHDLGLDDNVDVLGHIADVNALKSLYAQAVASLSPGYVGLSLTQSLGFGVPMLVADDEPHAPEVELLTQETGRPFRAGDESDLADQMVWAYGNTDQWDRKSIVSAVRDTYSSSAMARGFLMALTDVQQGERE